MLRSLARVPSGGVLARGFASRAAPVLSPSRRLSSSGVSSDSDKAFQAEKKTPVEDDEVQKWLGQAVKDHKVLLFMKGTPEAPQCGFSRKVALLLKENNAAFSSANVLSSPEIREGVKVFSKWPTLPQLYISGEFVGGCDIVSSLAESGELKTMLEKAGAIRKAA